MPSALWALPWGSTFSSQGVTHLSSVKTETCHEAESHISLYFYKCLDQAFNKPPIFLLLSSTSGSFPDTRTPCGLCSQLDLA